MITQRISGPRASVRVHHEVAYDRDDKTGLWLRRAEEDEIVENILLDAGRVRLHAQCYATSAILINGFNYIGLSSDGTSPDAGDTTLTGELSGDGLTRAQGTVTLATGSGNQTSIAYAFTYVGVSQVVQKAALFTAASSGVMAHEVLFTPRTLLTGSVLRITYTITLG